MNLPSFRFAGHPVCALYNTCLSAVLTDINVKERTLNLFAFVLPDFIIPFPLGLQDQHRLLFDICLCTGDVSHLKISSLQNIHNLTLSSRVWLSFKPRFPMSYQSRINKPLISAAVGLEIPGFTLCILNIDQPVLAGPPLFYADSIPPWLCRDWYSNLTPERTPHILRALKHLELPAILKMARQRSGSEGSSKEFIPSIHDLLCNECDENTTLPRPPLLSFPPDPSPNLAVSFDVLFQGVQNCACDVLIMLDHSNIFVRCALLPSRFAVSVFQTYYTHWISYFDSPSFSIIDCGTNYASKEIQASHH